MSPTVLFSLVCVLAVVHRREIHVSPVLAMHKLLFLQESPSPWVWHDSFLSDAEFPFMYFQPPLGCFILGGLFEF